MKIVLKGKAQSKPEVLGLLTEDVLLDPARAGSVLSSRNLKIEKIEMVNGEKVVHIVEKESNLLLG